MPSKAAIGSARRIEPSTAALYIETNVVEAIALAAYAGAKPICSASASSNKKNTQLAVPIKRYCSVCKRSAENSSNKKYATNVSPMINTAYLAARKLAS